MLIFFVILWCIFHTRVDVEVALLGLAVSLAVYWFCCRHMGYDPRTDRKILRKLFQGVAYIALLIWETVKANAAVSRVVYSKRIELEPQLIQFQVDLNSEAARVVLANSITLTPGTITVSLDQNHYWVHCLNSHMGDGIESSAFVRRLQQMEGGAPHTMPQEE